ncbi:anthranilate synthase component I family protein [Nitrospira moscoviensis]|uniref:Para-aminobenzoate synthase component 1 n=1 Tax=Nitrospira moscoviensis TaxID=42253 RepID=A0A0K2GHW7_NITMO|nr:anthranilate synthase component I family protein [Nitrospira moscoviensis]ALA60563.1 Para-aminobenzoate synthase component 1 [Nitrospira moscoviensis]
MTKPTASAFLQGPPSPLMVSLPAPPVSPLRLFARMASPGVPSFLFESGKGPSHIGRYSFFGAEPYQTLRGKEATWELRTADGRKQSGQGAFQRAAELAGAASIRRPSDAPPFFGGAVGYLSYDLVRQFEDVPAVSIDDLGTADLELGFFDLVAAVDHEAKRLVLMFCPPLERFLGEPREKLYREGCDRLAALEARLSHDRAAALPTDLPGRLEFVPEQTRSEYMERVGRCQEYIAAGDIYQANLSHRFTVPGSWFSGREAWEADLLAYDRVHAMNPSPFSGLLRFEETRFVSSSPERLVRLSGRQAETRPIAGTRPRGRTDAEDRQLADELRRNEKERAEHVMLVDLERNDLGRVCDAGSVRVDEFMALEQYSHVTHLVSNVTGRLRAGAGGFDLLQAVFPGGTITGVPKIRCMAVIDELEPVRRGPYTGSMGYISWSGDLDFNILIRTLVIRQGRAYLQVGAGIVADSDPAREYEETLYKAQAFFSAFS